MHVEENRLHSSPVPDSWIHWSLRTRESVKPEKAVSGNEGWQTRGLGRELLGPRTPREKHPSTCLA